MIHTTGHRPWHPLARAHFACLFLLFLASCGSSHDHGDDGNTRGQDTDVLQRDGDDIPPTDRPPLAVDILWVIDTSTSMCQEQNELAASVLASMHFFSEAAGLDVRMAATTTNVLDESQAGRFVTAPRKDSPYFCQYRTIFPTQSTLQCSCASCTGWDAAFTYEHCLATPGCEPPDDLATEYRGCLAAGGCDPPLSRAEWEAEFVLDLPESLLNANGSVNGTCHLNCAYAGPSQQEKDAACREELHNPDLVCQVLLNEHVEDETLSFSGCIEVSPATGCPPLTPAILPVTSAGDGFLDSMSAFPCIAVPGVDTSKTADLEQGLAAAWRALDPDGPRADQVCDDRWLTDETAGLTPQERRERCDRRFLRDGALLLLVFLSDEDDCSVKEDAFIAEMDYNQCAYLGSEDSKEGDPLVPWLDRDPATTASPLEPVETFVRRFQSLRPDPKSVLVSVIVGDAIPGVHPNEQRTKDEARAAYVASLLDTQKLYRRTTYICESEFGRSNYGGRYISFAERFGDRSIIQNICEPGWTEEILALLDRIQTAHPE